MTFRNWDELSELEQLQTLYSDLHKDVCGFRPRGGAPEEWNSVEWLKVEMNNLETSLKMQEAQEAADQKVAIEKFEQKVNEVLKAGAKDRPTALLKIFENEDVYVQNDLDYYCFLNGLPYGYFKKEA